MDSYLISFFILSLLTVISPGPAILFTISNVLNFGLRKSILGFLGVASGILLVAILATVSLILANKLFEFAFVLISVIGCIYFMYLSLLNWRCHSKMECKPENMANMYFGGILVSLLNPKALAFFVFIFPLYLNNGVIDVKNCITLSLIFSMNVIGVHSIYSLITLRLKHTFELHKLRRVFNKISALIFLVLSILLLKQTIGQVVILVERNCETINCDSHSIENYLQKTIVTL